MLWTFVGMHHLFGFHSFTTNVTYIAQNRSDGNLSMLSIITKCILPFRNKKVSRNELFAPGRMAYVIELEEEGTIDSDIPTTLTRSKADVPEPNERSTAASANDVVIEKLTQIFSYLRHGRHRKLKKTKVSGRINNILIINFNVFFVKYSSYC